MQLDSPTQRPPAPGTAVTVHLPVGDGRAPVVTADLNHYPPAPGSVAARELEAGGDLANGTLAYASMVLDGAHDHVVGLENLLAAKESAYAPQTVARALLEGAARAWWLLDPAIGGRERACWVFTERLESLSEGAKMERAATGGVGHATLDRIDHVADRARSYGLPVIVDDRGRPVAVGSRRLGATVLVARLLEGRGGDKVLGEVSFRAWSGAAHGMAWSLTGPAASRPSGSAIASGDPCPVRPWSGPAPPAAPGGR